MNLQQLFVLFIVYSFMGWVGEVIYCSIPEKHFINRGFLHGPVCPVYGCGGLLVIFTLLPFKDTWIELFLAAMFVTSVLEYITSWLMEILFHNRWWDYSHYKFNINGRVCLLNSVIFGAAGTLALRFVHPLVSQLIKSLKTPYIEIISGIFAVVFLTDIILTVRTLSRFNQKLKELKEFSLTLKNKFKGETWFEHENIHAMFKSLRARAKQEASPLIIAFIERLEVLNSKNRETLRILKAFPNIKNHLYNDQIDHIRFQLKVDIETKREKLKRIYAQKKGLPYEIVSKDEIIKKIEEQRQKQRDTLKELPPEGDK